MLALTSTSTEVPLTVQFERLPKLKFQDFLKSVLKFEHLSSDETLMPEVGDEMIIVYAISWNIQIIYEFCIINGKCKFQLTQMSMDISKLNKTERMDVDYNGAQNSKSLFFFCRENYFKGMLVRLKATDPLRIDVKVYLR